MTPQEKAKELVESFLDHVIADSKWDEDAHEDAKKCALKSVNMMLPVIEENVIDEIFNYWQSVKQELEKL